MATIGKNILALIKIMEDFPENMGKVPRWGRFLLPIRRQTTLHHTYSLVFLGMVVREKLKKRIKLDWELLLDALLLHDVGEGELLSDICVPSKTEERDLLEYLAFRKRAKKLGKISRRLEQAFLLQFALKNPPIFPADARQTMSWLAKNKRREALIFSALEHFDYILYALEQYFRDSANQTLLLEIIEYSLPILDKITKQIPSFKIIYGKTFRQGCMKLWQSLRQKQKTDD